MRLEALDYWLRHNAGLGELELRPLAGDASFRRYLRVHRGEETFIAVDAPPDKEDSRPFVRIAQLLRDIGLNAPQVLAADLDQGFMLLSDLGDELYLSALSDDSVERLYGDALGALATIQACGPNANGFPPYDEDLLRRELELFREWYLGRHLGLTLSGPQHAVLDEAFQHLIDSALEQPRVFVHRDYHSRNLMVTRHNPGILDFQDAVIGPVTYDLVSLLRDCYVDWPDRRVIDWALGYHELALHSGVLTDEDEERFVRWFDWMGVQRHLKASGIFARLSYRDGKHAYLNDIPRTLGYVLAVCASYPTLRDFHDLLLELLGGDIAVGCPPGD